MTTRKPVPPADLARRGAAFWRATVGLFALNESENRLLHECCRILDELEQLRDVIVADGVTTAGSQGQPVAHPALAAASSHRALLGRLLTQLNLPYDEDESTLLSPAQVRATKAAQVRWANAKHKAGRRGA
jgi:hypothetical protein